MVLLTVQFSFTFCRALYNNFFTYITGIIFSCIGTREKYSKLNESKQFRNSVCTELLGERNIGFSRCSHMS